MQIARKIYFEKATGNIILDTGEREGSVVQTTVDQDFSQYEPLQRYFRASVGVIELSFGQDREKFAQYRYHIDPATKQIVWDLTPIQQEEADKQQTMDEKVAHLEQADVNISQDITSLVEILVDKGVL